MHAFLLGVVAFLLGSFPTAYVLLRRASGQDIRALGSGNVGARNAYEITGNRVFGVAVGIIDAGKGIAAAMLWHAFGEHSAVAFDACLAGAILGHVFSPWIGFRGGRGLATGGGLLLATVPVAAALWGAAWIAAMRMTNDIIRGNLIASMIGVAAMVVIPDSWLSAGFAQVDSIPVLRVGLAATMVIIGLSHFRGPSKRR